MTMKFAQQEMQRTKEAVDSVAQTIYEATGSHPYVLTEMFAIRDDEHEQYMGLAVHYENANDDSPLVLIASRDQIENIEKSLQQQLASQTDTAER